MKKKLNCWEFLKCGREPGGNKTDEHGVCPVAVEKAANGLNGGINGGRICWIIAEALSVNGGGCFKAHHSRRCFQCEFRYKVMNDEGLLNVCIATGSLIDKLENNKLQKADR